MHPPFLRSARSRKLLSASCQAETRYRSTLDWSQGERHSYTEQILEQEVPMTPEQRQKLTDLLAHQHVLVVATQGEQWPTATMQAFAETPNLDIVLIMLESSVKFQNLSKKPQVTLLVDNRDKGDVQTLQVARAAIQGVAREIPKHSPEWDTLKTIFLTKNPFEEPFFQYEALRMVCVSPRRVSYANGVSDAFTVEL
jgi:nitroimidazol reductase NimA-like FMN-containing flavoprotein (pyridoxamine 5'-phosphate oxidase superfamily)